MVELQVTGFQEGVGAFYHQVDLRSVCERRVAEGWNPGLDCSWPCLAAAITSDPMQLGDYWLVDLPGGSLHI